MKFLKYGVQAAVIVLLTGSAFANPISIPDPGSDSDPVNVKFTGVNGVADFGYYIGPYYGTINGSPVTLYCVDFANEVYFGQTWEANLTSLDGTGNLADTRYGGVPNALTLYREAAWLTTQYALHPEAMGDIQATIWQLFVSYAPTPSSNYWLLQAQQNYQTLDFSRFELVTNVGPVKGTGQVQEFLIDPAPVPEPSSVILFGTSLVLVGTFVRRTIGTRS